MRSKLELLKQLAFSLADQVVVSACTFLTMVLISNHCTKADVGVFALTVTIVNLIRTVQERTIAAPYLAFAFREGFDRPSFKGSSFVHQAILGAIATIVIVLITAAGYLLGNSRSWTVVLASLAMVLPLTLLRDQIRSMAAASFQLSQQLMFDSVVGASQLLGIIALGWANRFSIAWVNIVLGLACVLPTLVWFGVHGKRIEVDSAHVLQDWKNNWHYSRWLVGARIFGIFGYFVVPWLVWYFLDEAATGAFAVCNSLVGVSLMCVTGLNNLFQPRTIRELQHSGIRGMIVSMIESIAVVIGILSVISIGFYFFGSVALVRIFGVAYADYGHVAFILSLSTLAVSLAILFGNGLAALGNSREYFLGELSCCVVSVSAALVFIPWFGLNGAAASLALGGLAASVVTGWTLYRAIVRYQPTIGSRSIGAEDAMLEISAPSSSSSSTPVVTN
jgi:O-antigen/teichoic acid export membrane protein